MKPIIHKYLPIISLIIALIGVIPGIITTLNYFNKPKINVSYDEGKSFISLLASDKKEDDGKKVIGFYEIKFVGGENPSSIKNIQFFLRNKDNFIFNRWIEGKQIVLRTIDIDKYKACIIIGNPNNNVILSDWINFIPYSDKYFLEQGKTSQFNIAYEFDRSIKDINESMDWKFIITDYYGNKYTIKIKSPATFNMVVNDNTANYVLFDCYLQKSTDTFEMLKSINANHIEINYLKIQKYLKAKYNHSEQWYEKWEGCRVRPERMKDGGGMGTGIKE